MTQFSILLFDCYFNSAIKEEVMGSFLGPDRVKMLKVEHAAAMSDVMARLYWVLM